MPKYTIQQLESALEQVTDTNELSDLFKALINEKLALLRKAGKPKSEISFRERNRIYQQRARAKRKLKKLENNA